MKQFPLKKIVIYLIIPVVGSLILIGAYFSGSDLLQEIVSPPINREYGLVENLQLVLLAGIALIAIFGLKRKKTRPERWIMTLILAGAIFMLLEESDYGLHQYKLLTGDPIDERVGRMGRNIHNLGDNSDRFKHTGDIGMILLFIVVPLLFARSRRPLLRYLTPDRFFIMTMVAMFLISKFAHLLEASGVGDPGSLHGRISEFRELIIYYIFAVYFFDLVFRREYSKGEPQEVDR